MQKMTSSDPTSKLFSDSGQKCYEPSRTDSGFLSGANLVSEENLSVEDLSAGQSGVDVDFYKNNENSVQMDSGVDVGLNEQFSGLTLEKKSIHDLTSSAKSKLLISSNSESAKINKEKSKEITVSEPWELYFQQDDEGDTQLHIAIIQGFIEVVSSLIKMVPHPCFLDIPNDALQSPLHLAVLTHQPLIVRWLVVAGASVETQDRHGNTALHLACQTGDFECVKSLTEPISVSETGNAGLLYTAYPQVPQDLEERNYDGETCLHLAAYGGHTDILRHLIWFGANVNAREDKSGMTVLHFAVETLNHELLRFLLDECSFGPTGLVIDTRNYAGHTAFQLARVLDSKVAQHLVSRGAYIGVEDVDEDEDDHPDHNALDGNEEVGITLGDTLVVSESGQSRKDLAIFLKTYVTKVFHFQEFHFLRKGVVWNSPDQDNLRKALGIYLRDHRVRSQEAR